MKTSSTERLYNFDVHHPFDLSEIWLKAFNNIKIKLWRGRNCTRQAGRLAGRQASKQANEGGIIQFTAQILLLCLYLNCQKHTLCASHHYSMRLSTLFTNIWNSVGNRTYWKYAKKCYHPVKVVFNTAYYIMIKSVTFQILIPKKKKKLTCCMATWNTSLYLAICSLRTTFGSFLPSHILEYKHSNNDMEEGKRHISHITIYIMKHIMNLWLPVLLNHVAYSAIIYTTTFRDVHMNYDDAFSAMVIQGLGEQNGKRK